MWLDNSDKDDNDVVEDWIMVSFFHVANNTFNVVFSSN